MSDRFAILNHDWPEPHRDLLLEHGGVLRAWRFPAECDFLSLLPALAIADHRLAYLDYEGPVSGNRGAVTRWDSGELRWISESADRLKFELLGKYLDGQYEFCHILGDSWTFQQLLDPMHDGQPSGTEVP